MEQRDCKQCGEPFEFKASAAKGTRANRGQFCSTLCFNEYKKAQRLEKQCPACNTLFYVPKSRAWRKYCSAACTGVTDGLVTLTCGICQSQYTRWKSRLKRRGSSYCSVACRVEGQRRKARFRKQAKTRLKTQTWRAIREEVLARDGHVCVRCQSADKLVVHHKVRWVFTQDDSLENLVTLCRSCHYVVEWFGADIYQKGVFPC